MQVFATPQPSEADALAEETYFHLWELGGKHSLSAKEILTRPGKRSQTAEARSLDGAQQCALKIKDNLLEAGLAGGWHTFVTISVLDISPGKKVYSGPASPRGWVWVRIGIKVLNFIF